MINRFPVLKTALRELFFRPGWYCDSFQDLERVFQWSEDPWNFQNSRYERDRLNFLHNIVEEYCCETILEVGCAEGIFTSRLQGLAKQVVAIDVSSTALSRAKQRCPDVVFYHKSLADFNWATEFDLVICSETLYYMKDVAGAIDKLSSLGKRCMVSYIHRETKNLDPYFCQMQLEKYLRFEKSSWLWNRAMSVAIWKNNGAC